MAKELIITFENDGKTVHKETKGFSGSSCVQETEWVEKALGSRKNFRKKREYHVEEEKHTVKRRLSY